MLSYVFLSIGPYILKCNRHVFMIYLDKEDLNFSRKTEKQQTNSYIDGKIRAKSKIYDIVLIPFGKAMIK